MNFRKQQDDLVRREFRGDDVVSDAEQFINDLQDINDSDRYTAGQFILYWAGYIFRETGIAPNLGLRD